MPKKQLLTSHVAIMERLSEEFACTGGRSCYIRFLTSCPTDSLTCPFFFPCKVWLRLFDDECLIQNLEIKQRKIKGGS